MHFSSCYKLYSLASPNLKTVLIIVGYLSIYLHICNTIKQWYFLKITFKKFFYSLCSKILLKKVKNLKFQTAKICTFFSW